MTVVFDGGEQDARAAWQRHAATFLPHISGLARRVRFVHNLGGGRKFEFLELLGGYV